MFRLEYKISFELHEFETLKHRNTRCPNIPSLIAVTDTAIVTIDGE